MCSQPYDLRDYKNPYRHLTNYSLNKNNFDLYNKSQYEETMNQFTARNSSLTCFKIASKFRGKIR